MTTRKRLQEEIFAEFAEKNKRKLLRIALPIVGGDWDLAEDAYQQALLSWLQRGIFQTGDKDFNAHTEAQRFSGLKRAIKNKAADIVRRRKGGHNVEGVTLPFLEGQYRTEQSTDRVALVRGIDKLTARQRECVRLVHEEGLGSSEAGRRLGIHESVVRRHLSRAYKKLGLSLDQTPKAVSRIEHNVEPSITDGCSSLPDLQGHCKKCGQVLAPCPSCGSDLC